MANIITHTHTHALFFFLNQNLQYSHIIPDAAVNFNKLQRDKHTPASPALTAHDVINNSSVIHYSDTAYEASHEFSVSRAP